jgi:hypothetical protein
MNAIKSLGKKAMLAVYLIGFILIVIALNKLFGDESEGIISKGVIILLAILVFVDRQIDDILEYLKDKDSKKKDV